MGCHQLYHYMTSFALCGSQGHVRLLLTNTTPCSLKCPVRSRGGGDSFEQMQPVFNPSLYKKLEAITFQDQKKSLR